MCYISDVLTQVGNTEDYSITNWIQDDLLQYAAD